MAAKAASASVSSIIELRSWCKKQQRQEQQQECSTSTLRRGAIKQLPCPNRPNRRASLRNYGFPGPHLSVEGDDVLHKLWVGVPVEGLEVVGGH